VCELLATNFATAVYVEEAVGTLEVFVILLDFEPDELQQGSDFLIIGSATGSFSWLREEGGICAFFEAQLELRRCVVVLVWGVCLVLHKINELANAGVRHDQSL